jgi:hypothetical protein
MTQTLASTEPADGDVALAESPRPGSRAARMAHPLSVQAIRMVAAEHGVCIQPVAMRRTDLETGRTEVIDLPCGSTRESKCPGCARRAKRLRQQQCREGWHRTDEPLPEPELDEEQQRLILLRADYEFARAACLARSQWDQVAELDAAISEVEALIAASGLRGTVTPPRPGEDEDQADDDEWGPPRKRSTRRRQDAPDLPRRTIKPTTVGRTFAAKDGKVFRPSMFLTPTLPSYGRVREDGSPVNPATYDYRRQAWDAVHFAALLDRFWQNLRRVEGWNVQYFGAVEPQRRLAPHAHFAIRGAVPRVTLKQVIAASYHQVWWPSTATVRYPEHAPQPVWDDERNTFVDPATSLPLPTWDEALDTLDAEPDAEPEHVVRFGEQVDIQGVLGETDECAKMIGYLTKYLTKSVAECHTVSTPAAIEHQRRLWDELRFTPCSDRCANWLRYGVQPDKARPKMLAGRCKAKVHQLDTLGIGGRRVLVSRNWSGKTLADHKWDQVAWVRKVLAVNLDEDQAQVDAPKAEWSRVLPGEPGLDDMPRRLLRAISTRMQHKAALAAARAADPPPNVSATAVGSAGRGAASG